MLKGTLQVVSPKDMDKIHDAVLNVLETTGLHIRGEFILRALADAGCRVDFKAQRAWFKPELLEKQLAGQRDRYRMVRSSLWYPFCREMPRDDAAVPDEFVCDYGFGAPSMYDAATGKRRKPTAQDQIDAIKLGNGLECVGAVCSPYILGDCDPRVEVVESARLLLANTRKPGWVGTSCAAEVKHLAEMANLAVGGDKEALRTQPPVFVHAYCTTSPLKIDARSCEVLEEAIRHKFPVNFAPMPILGGTTPVTPAGSMVVAAAEILGGIAATTLIAPALFYYATVISAEMDMRTTQVCYATPAAILTDAALHQLFREKYGIVCNVEPAYVEAKTPGIQAAFMKTFRQMALGATASHSLPLGLLDNGSVFSPAQAMIDLDLNAAMHKFAKGIEVSDETLCVNLINELEFCERGNYLESEHTFRHFREVLWHTNMLDRTYSGGEDAGAAQADEALLKRADAAWREIVAAQQEPQRDAAFLAELDRIADHARRDLLATPAGG